MNAKHSTDRAMQAQLDRLAAGELPENDRRSLLAWLDEDAARWRACALAFLEAQNWEAAAASWPATNSASKCLAREHDAPTASDGRWKQVLALAAAAAL